MHLHPRRRPKNRSPFKSARSTPLVQSPPGQTDQPVATKPQYKRSIRSFLLEPFKQVRIGLYLVLLTFGFTILLILLFFDVMYRQHLRTMEMLGMSDGSSYWDLLENPIVISGLTQIGLALVAFTLVTVATSIVLTHRVYGPLVSIRRLVRTLTTGDFSARVHIRKHDDLHDLADELNALADSLEHRAAERPGDTPSHAARA